MKRLSLAVAAILFAVLTISHANADFIEPMANENQVYASVSFGQNGMATFLVTTTSQSEIKVSAVTLEYKDSSGKWKWYSNLSAPTDVGHSTYTICKDYSNNCSPGYTYRIVATFVVNGVSTKSYSGGVKY